MSIPTSLMALTAFALGGVAVDRTGACGHDAPVHGLRQDLASQGLGHGTATGIARAHEKEGLHQRRPGKVGVVSRGVNASLIDGCSASATTRRIQLDRIEGKISIDREAKGFAHYWFEAIRPE